MVRATRPDQAPGVPSRQVFKAPGQGQATQQRRTRDSGQATKESTGMRAAGWTNLPHARGRVDIALDAREDGAVVSQEDAFLVSAAAPELAGLVRGDVDDAHGGPLHPSLQVWGLFHSYCACRRGSSGCRMVGVAQRVAAMGEDLVVVANTQPSRGRATEQRRGRRLDYRESRGLQMSRCRCKGRKRRCLRGAC